MHTEKREDPLVELGYEVRDLNTVAIRNATIGFFIFAIGSAVIGFACYRFMNPTVFAATPPSNRVIPAPPNPLIQSNVASKLDIMDIRQHETAVLTEPMGWVDTSKTHVHVPIERAMEIIAERGLPSPAQKAAAAKVAAVKKVPLPPPSGAPGGGPGGGGAGGAGAPGGGPPPPKAAKPKN